jgi:hypothetical protein
MAPEFTPTRREKEMAFIQIDAALGTGPNSHIRTMVEANGIPADKAQAFYTRVAGIVAETIEEQRKALQPKEDGKA